jgi:hypothetical protein
MNYRWAYFKIVEHPEKMSFDKFAKQVSQRLGREPTFWKNFRRDAAESLKKEFRVPITVYVPPDETHARAARLQRFADELSHRSLPSGDPADFDRVTARFPTFEDLQWSQVTIAFTTPDRVRIDARGTTREFTFIQLGFKDKRDNNPDTRWELLKRLALHRGELALGSEISTKDRNRASKAIGKINDNLRSLMGLNDDPIEYDRNEGKYKTVFSLDGRTLAANLGNDNAQDAGQPETLSAQPHSDE